MEQRETTENYLQTNHDWGSHWETAKDEPCQVSGDVTAISAECTIPEWLPRRFRQGANPELCAPQLITMQLARERKERQWFWQQPCFTVALNNALVKGDQGPCRAGRITQGGRGTTSILIPVPSFAAQCPTSHFTFIQKNWEFFFHGRPNPVRRTSRRGRLRLTWWVDISKELKNKQLESWGYKMRDKGSLKHRWDRKQGGRWHLRGDCNGSYYWGTAVWEQIGTLSDELHRSHIQERSTRMRNKVKKGTSIVFTETEGLHWAQGCAGREWPQRRRCWALRARASVGKQDLFICLWGSRKTTLSLTALSFPRSKATAGQRQWAQSKENCSSCDKHIFTSKTCPCSRRKLLMQ